MSANTLSSNTELVFLRPARSIGGLYMDVTIEEAHTDELEITEHPVEKGAAVTDHAYLKPAKLTIKAGVTDARADNNVNGDRLTVAMYEALRKLQATREPFDVVTGKRVYGNMLIKSLGVVTDAATENVLMLSMELQQIIIVNVSVVAVPRARQMKRSTNATKEKGKEQVTKRPSVMKGAKEDLSQMFGRRSS
jgi:hypothetical protein